MKDFLLLFSTLALLLSGFAVMDRLDCWIEHTRQRALEELRAETPDELRTETSEAEISETETDKQQAETITQKIPDKSKLQGSLWISSRLCDKIILPKHATNYRGMGQCSSYKKGI